MIDNETAVQFQAFLLKHPYSDIDASITQLSDTTTRNFGERIYTTHYHTRYPTRDDKVCTRGSLSIMRTRFQTDINGRLSK
jgi:hypothetical protein